ncbi:hypothetical protein DF035_23495 [Burkholderia contaminans]|nr:hypothetical protein DF035_23495 [Burkholderia contaminans]
MVHRRNIYGIVIWCFLFDQCPDMRECYRVLRRSAGRKARARKGGERGCGIRIPVWFASRDCQGRTGLTGRCGGVFRASLRASRGVCELDVCQIGTSRIG